MLDHPSDDLYSPDDDARSASDTSSLGGLESGVWTRALPAGLPPSEDGFPQRPDPGKGPMIRLRVIQAGCEDRVIESDSRELVLGRAEGCDVRIEQAHVSKRHAVILAGLVVVDLGSSNGTFLRGRRVAPAALLEGEEFQLGGQEGDVRVVVEAFEAGTGESIAPEATQMHFGDFRVDQVAGNDTQAPDPESSDSGATATELGSGAGERSAALEAELAQLRDELDAQRRKSEGLAEELAERTAAEAENTEEHGESEAPSASGSVDFEALPIVQELRQELGDARSRLESLKQDVEARDVEASEELQVRLAREELEQVRTEAEQLRTRVAELESKESAPSALAAKNTLAKRVAELEAASAEHLETIGRLTEELDEARERAAAEPAPASDLFFQLQAENSKLREQLQSAASGSDTSSPELFFQLQSENAKLRRELEAAGGGAVAGDTQAGESVSEPALAGVGRLAELEKENHALALSKADLLDELDLLRRKVGSEGAPRIPAQAIGDGTGELETRLQRAADEDVEGWESELAGAPGAFLGTELFRFTRQVERVVTRMAGNFIQLMDNQTMLPDLQGNLRHLTQAVLDEPEQMLHRAQLVEYMAELRTWLLASLMAHRKAAERFAEEIRSELSEKNLTADQKVPPMLKFTGRSEVHLWRRSSEHIKRLTSDVVEERLERLSRECAEEIRREENR